jgi:hypothetical protein
MTAQQRQPSVNLQALMNAQFDAAKFYQNMAALCSVLTLAIDLYVTFTNQYQKELAFLAAGLVITSGALLWRSNRLRDTAEGMLRKFELNKGLGWAISARELSDILASAPGSVKKAARSAAPETYFTDTTGASPTKLLKNLEESAWWTKQLAKRMTVYTAAVSIVVGVIASFTLIVALESALSQNIADSIAKATISVIVFVFSGGYVKLAFDYNLLAQEADRAEDRACELLKSSPDEGEAIKALHDYQIARVTAPLIPTLVWKISQKELKSLWDERTSGALGT